MTRGRLFNFRVMLLCSVASFFACTAIMSFDEYQVGGTTDGDGDSDTDSDTDTDTDTDADSDSDSDASAACSDSPEMCAVDNPCIYGYCDPDDEWADADGCVHDLEAYNDQPCGPDAYCYKGECWDMGPFCDPFHPDGTCPDECDHTTDADCCNQADCILIGAGEGRDDCCPGHCARHRDADCIYCDNVATCGGGPEGIDLCCPPNCDVMNDFDCCEMAVCGLRDSCCPSICTAEDDPDCF